MELKQWIEQNQLNVEFVTDSYLKIGEINFVVVTPKDNDENVKVIFDENFILRVGDEELDIVEKYELTDWNWLYNFGGNWFYSKQGTEAEITLNDFKYIGKSVEIDPNLEDVFIGIHGQFELLNGSGLYDDWIKKAKFLNIKTLGICEKNTLAGVLKLQNKCTENKIKFIIGETVTVRSNNVDYDIKLFVKDVVGWKNLLLINKEINFINHVQYIDVDKLFKLSEGLVCVLDPKSQQFNEREISLYNSRFKELYYQLDSVIFDNNSKEKEFLINTKKFVDSDLQPILISDAYYIDKDQYKSKIILNQIANKFEASSKTQYLKTINEQLGILFNLFPEEKLHVLDTSVVSLYNLIELCQFNVETGKRKLPKYQMSEEESKLYIDSEDLFLSLIAVGMQERIPEDKHDEYWARFEEEYEVIKMGDVIDYFLILWDVSRFCRNNDILMGIARGSAGGCLIAYLLYIINIDPLQYNLLFSRFLNAGRIKKSLPDIDLDFPQNKRGIVKKYLEEHYGFDYVCSIGTYTNLQLKASLKEICRFNNVPFETSNYISSILDEHENSWDDLFKKATKRQQLKSFIHKYPHIINDIKLIFGLPKSASIHPCATIIVPQEFESGVFSLVPTRLAEKGSGEKLLVSEWEGAELDSAGFLKEDILGVEQIDKFVRIKQLIKEQYNEDIDLYNIDLDNKEVFELFKHGYTSDVFQFGTRGLTKYCKDLKPENINDLIAAVAIYRPGPMESGVHNKYVRLKEGFEKPVFDPGTEVITSETYGLYIYQEQVMQVCCEVGGLTLVDADDVRKSMVKKNIDVLLKYKKQFIDGAVNGKYKYTQEDADKLWDKMESFASYGFNKSHAAAYAITGYIGQWLKYKYPLQFWIVAFEYAKDEEIPLFISEIKKIDDHVHVNPPDINHSTNQFTFDNEGNIYWSISKIKHCGDVAVQAILDEREKNGEFYSFEEFIKRVPGNKVNKRVIENMIFAGCFDKMCNIKDQSSRYSLVKEYNKLKNVKEKKTKKKEEASKDIFELNHRHLEDNIWWTYKQREITGLAYFNYITLLRRSQAKWDLNKFFNTSKLDFQDDQLSKDNKKVIICGFVNEFNKRVTKKQEEFCQLLIESNYEYVFVNIWPTDYERIKHKLIESPVGKMVAISGFVSYDSSYRKENILQTNENSDFEIFY